ncbi:MAG: U32 family peptidase [Muribaculaceae bacterium]|nr:U32 family peptidase [Muribaculaceae bacterium]
MRTLELLSPARDAAVGRAAILAGADAVYIGAPAFGARAAAGNDVESIKGLCDFAHRYRARVYVTMNTILFDSELEQARELVWSLWRAGVDALIVQDMAYLEMELPPIELHASTQCDIRTPEKARFLAAAGFSQLVLPREFTLSEIKAVREAAGVPVEVFVHGALCVSYSGDCQAGCVAMGRSANRGVCPQMCRLPYRLVDASGHDVAPERHYLSLKDLKQIDNLADMVEAGASSFKIEGRLKDARYVANVTAAYSRALDAVVAAAPDQYCRSSAGRSTCGFTPDLRRTFNRGYTSYFLRGKVERSMASLDTPKWAGMPVGEVSTAYDSRRRSFGTRLSETLANGDGLGYFDSRGHFCGFRLNKVEGAALYPATPLEGLKPGMKLYRNADKEFFDSLDRPDAGCSRTIALDIELAAVDDSRISLAAHDERGCSATVVVESPADVAKTDQTAARQRTMAKLGDTIYTLGTLADGLGSRFVAASVLADGRRRLVQALDAVAASTYARKPRAAAKPEELTLAGKALTYHDNVANSLARRLYERAGAAVAESAIELQGRVQGEVTVMTTRYCIRRELGACLREKGASKLPTPLFLTNPSGTYRLDFDCARCGMKVVKCAKA